MLNVLKCIQERKNYGLKKNEDEWIDEIISSKVQDEKFFITAERFVIMHYLPQREKLLSKYQLAGIFELGNPFISTNASMVLVYLVPQKEPMVKTSVYSGDTYNKKKCKHKYSAYSGKIEIPDKYQPEYLEYIKKLERWINKGIIPRLEGTENYEFNEISVKDLDAKYYYPGYYTKDAIEVRKLAQKENFLKLSDIADIIPSRNLKDAKGSVKRLNSSDFYYPLDVDSLDEGKPTTVCLQKGDIVYAMLGNQGVYLYNVDSDIPVYPNTASAVIRCKNILPEYLYLYLNSNVAKQLCSMYSPQDNFEKISPANLMELPVARPSLNDEEYIRDFQLLTAANTRDYKIYGQGQNLQNYQDYLKELQEKENNPKKVEDILDIEIAKNIKVNNEEQLRSLLTEDLKELNTCFAHGAYKATLILAGSILEAVLIDWLSEIDGKDYFNEKYIVINPKTGKPKSHASLYDYIDAIKEIEKPKWDHEADEANEIRRERNLVHAKLGINTNDINEKTCREVIQYLKDVIKTRGVS